MAEMNRRDFLRLVGIASTSVAMGCSSGPNELIPYLNPPEDIAPGEATWFATTCRECPAGCGMLAKNRDSRLIKVEGNPLHPVSRGTLCPRGQASLHGLYNPDRLRAPARKTETGDLAPISWDEAEKLLLEKLQESLRKGRGERIVFLSELVTGARKKLVELWLSQLGSNELVLYEALAYEPLRTANRIVFGEDAIPTYRIDQADFLLSFHAGFLETWLSNVEYSREFADFHAAGEHGKHFFAFVGPRSSLTAANADQWIEVDPGREYLVGLGILRVIMEENLVSNLPGSSKALLQKTAEGLSLQQVADRTAIDIETLRKVARRFSQAKRPLALAEGLPYAAPHATGTAVIANLLCSVVPGTRDLLDFRRKHALSDTVRAEAMKQLADRMRRKEIDILLIDRANPVFNLPDSWAFAKSLEAVPFVVSFSSWPDETSRFAHLLLPTLTPLECWGEYSPRDGVIGLMQPAMGSVFPTRQLEDILLSTGKALKGTQVFPWRDSYEVLRENWRQRWKDAGSAEPFETFWLQAVQRGGMWTEATEETNGRPLNATFDYTFPDVKQESGEHDGYQLVLYPTIQFYDGRMANRPWLQELPDPLTQTTWGAWVEMHPETARKIGVGKGEVVRLKSPYGSVEVPVIPVYTVSPGTVAVPIGQGHTSFGRFASNLPANPMQLYPADTDGESGAIGRPELTVAIEKTGGYFAIAHTDGSYHKHGRHIAETMTVDDYLARIAANRKPAVDVPLPSSYNPRKDFYPPHPPRSYRWCMVLDMDRCIGCGACAVACYAENNLAVVGREHVLQGREMSWLMVQRYFETDDPRKVRFLVMLCQHCTEAPCEAVCPVFAPHHSIEGINNQVYNRCIGTRDCSQNDPYKVRRFNFFTYTRPSPLDWQLNPDVTVRQKGVMEKCSFCIQRIVKAKIDARNEGRKVRDGDFTTACAQTCPTGALTFGSLLDPDSRVSQLIEDVRAQQILKELNTKPAAIYLKKITQEL